MKQVKEEFLPDPLQPTPKFFPAERSGHTKTIEEERRDDLEVYRLKKLEDQSPLETEVKEEPLSEEVELDVAKAEAEAGKIHLPTCVPVKTIRLDLDKFNAFFSKKYYRVKMDYDLYFEVNADNPKECIDKIMDFIEAQLKGMLLEGEPTKDKEEQVQGGKNGRYLKLTRSEISIEEYVPFMRNREDDTDYSLD